MTSDVLSIPDSQRLEEYLPLISHASWGYDHGTVALKVEHVVQDFYTVVQYLNDNEEHLDHAVFATREAAEQYYIETVNMIQDYIDSMQNNVERYASLAEELEEPVAPGEFDPAQKYEWEVEHLAYHEEFLTHLEKHGVQSHYGAIPVYMIQYPAWVHMEKRDIQNTAVEGLVVVETKRFVDFFAAQQILEHILGAMRSFGEDAQNFFGHTTYGEAFAHEDYLESLLPRYTLMQLFAARNKIFSYKDFRKVLKKFRKSAHYTPEQVDRMFDQYRSIQGWITRTVFEQFIAEHHENIDWFIAGFDTESLRDAVEQYVHDTITRQRHVA